MRRHEFITLLAGAATGWLGARAQQHQRWPEDAAGRWLLRRYIDGKYSVRTLALADDAETADGERVMSFEMAEAAARALVDRPARGHSGRLTVRVALANYVEFQRAQGKPTGDLLSRATAHILPTLGDAVVADLTSARLRNWLATLAAMPAMKRTRADAPQQYKAEPDDEEGIRRRRSSGNRVLTMLKAALNHAYDEQHVASNEAWGRRLKPFRDVETARVRYLTIVEAKRLLNACDPDFRLLVQAALETGCRYSELARLQVADFNADTGTLNVRRSKTGKPRHVVLSEEGTAFFRQTNLGRPSDALMFGRTDGTAWRTSHQSRPMKEASERANLRPPITFHGLRHSWASLATMNGVPLMIVAKNLGHRDTRMCERHYDHFRGRKRNDPGENQSAGATLPGGSIHR